MRRPGSARGGVLCLEEPGRGVTAQPPADAGPAGGGVFGQGCGKNSRAQVVVVVNLGGCLDRLSAGRGGGWLFCPFCELFLGGCGEFCSNLHGEVGEPVMTRQPVQARLR